MKKIKYIEFLYLYRVDKYNTKYGSMVFECRFGLNLKDEEEFIRNFLIDGEWFIAKDLNLPSLQSENDLEEEWHEFIGIKPYHSPKIELNYPKWDDFCCNLPQNQYDTFVIKISV
ncbi:MAG: hypothetical protein KDK36_20495 [Leptospiraceae bacterium]|nr:hypothetical protein [Leptospiraceae bacterium]